MAHPIPLPFPCPVQLGRIKGDSLESQLHEYVREGNYVKVKKLLKKGIFVDAVNSMGQTCLFTAALLGLGKIVDVLLEYGSDANHRCSDGSTPVHAAAFSGNQWILSRLLDEGGDLRAHDREGRTPQCWALSASKESSAQMLEFIQQCTLHMQAAIWNLPSDLLRKVGSSKALICSPSRFGGLVQGSVEIPLAKLLKGQPSMAKNIYSFGFGKFCLTGSGHLGYLASLPIIGDKDVVQADDEKAFSYPVGPYMTMTNLMWGGSRVTVKELSLQPQQSSWKLRLADLLLAEQEHCSKLRHPHLLQLMSVCLSSDLEKTRLVYERVHFGSLYSILHERRAEFPVLQTETLLHVLLQIIDALRFLHSRGFVHRSLSSYAVQIVSSGEAKLCNLEYMVESKDSGEHSDLTRIPVPVRLFRWSSPEIILEKPGTVKSDVYSFCAVLQETLTESPPWKAVEDSAIKELILSGQQLEADARLPLIYYDVVKSGLEPKHRNRSMKLQDIQYILKKDLKVICSILIFDGCAVSFQIQVVLLKSRGGDPTLSGFSAPQDSAFPRESSALGVEEAAASAEPAAQEQSLDVSSELQTGASPSCESDVGGSLCSFEMNEILASYPEGPQDFLEGGPGLGQALEDAERQQEEGEESPWEGEEEEEEEEEGESLVSSTGFSGEEEELEEEEEEEEERVREASALCQLRGDAGRRLSSPSQSEQHISKCALNLKIMQSMLQQAGESLGRTEEKLDRLEAMGKQKKLLQEIRMNLLPEESSQGRHWNGSDATSQNTNKAFSGVDIFLHKAVAPPSRNYIPPSMCQAPGRDSFQAVPKTAKEREAAQNEKWRSKTATNHRDLGCKGLGDERFSISIQAGFKLYLKWKELFTEVKQMARRVASGQLGLSCAHPASECTSESEAEGVQESSLPVPATAPRSQEQQRCGWQPGGGAEPWHLGTGDRAESGDSDLEPALWSSGEGHSRELHCSLNSPPDVTEEFFTPDYSLPPALEERSEPEVKITFFGHNLHNISVADIQDLSSIPCEQNFQRGVECKTPRLSHAPTSVSTPLGSGNAGRGKKDSQAMISPLQTFLPGFFWIAMNEHLLCASLIGCNTGLEFLSFV
uniref:Inactive serine/threonine-protein kinase TEX14 n=1 Tax=Catharus ustulatus TaxID=91951 RepID=A0A8C3UNI4_CATUS